MLSIDRLELAGLKSEAIFPYPRDDPLKKSVMHGAKPSDIVPEWLLKRHPLAIIACMILLTGEKQP